MTRVIKFRAWDLITKQMVDEFEITSTGEARYDYMDADYFNDHKPESKLIPMQYTGLKDKNGVEVYEGDIVRRFYSDGEVIGKLEIKIPECFYGERKEMEVIGNIYQNPNLLK